MNILRSSPMFDSVEFVPCQPNVVLDLNEGVLAALSCIACHHDEARIGMAHPVRMYVASLDCCECGEQLVEFDVMSGRIA